MLRGERTHYDRHNASQKINEEEFIHNMNIVANGMHGSKQGLTTESQESCDVR